MGNQNIWNYSALQDGVIERSIKIKAKKSGNPIHIAQITDLHFNFCNQKDFEENDPVLMSTYQNREWLKNASSVDNAIRCLEHVSSADAIVITGDILDYLSYGCEELAVKHVFAPYPNVIAVLGNHEAARKVQGIHPEVMSYEQKAEWLKSFWKNDLYYSSTVLDERIMIIQMDNCSEYVGFREEQIKPFTEDIELARRNDYTILLFFHVHISPNDEKYTEAQADRVGKGAWEYANLNVHGISEKHGEASEEILKIIKSNADIIGGCFCGHLHSDFYCEINAENGFTIPQYILMGTPYDDGHILNIVVE